MNERNNLAASAGDRRHVAASVRAVALPEVTQGAPSGVEPLEPVADRLIAEQHERLGARLFELGEHGILASRIGERLRYRWKIDARKPKLLRSGGVLAFQRARLTGVHARVGDEIAEPRVGACRPERLEVVLVEGTSRRSVHAFVGRLERPRAIGQGDPGDDLRGIRAVPKDGRLARDGESADEEFPVGIKPPRVDRAGVNPEDEDVLRRPIPLEHYTERLAEGVRSRHRGHDRPREVFAGAGCNLIAPHPLMPRSAVDGRRGAVIVSLESRSVTRRWGVWGV